MRKRDRYEATRQVLAEQAKPAHVPLEEYRARRMHNLLDAIEAFVDAKVSYALTYQRDPQWANHHDVEETRDHLCDKLAEVLS